MTSIVIYFDKIKSSTIYIYISQSIELNKLERRFFRQSFGNPYLVQLLGPSLLAVHSILESMNTIVRNGINTFRKKNLEYIYINSWQNKRVDAGRCWRYWPINDQLLRTYFVQYKTRMVLMIHNMCTSAKIAHRISGSPYSSNRLGWVRLG